VKNRFWLRFSIDEGEPIRVASILVKAFRWRSVAEETELGQALRDVLTLAVGERFSRLSHGSSQEQLTLWLNNRGRPFAVITDSVIINEQARRADVTYWIDEGPEAFLDSIVVEGNQRVDRHLIARELNMKAGDRYSQRLVTGAQRELTLEYKVLEYLLLQLLADASDSPVRLNLAGRYAY